MYILAIDTSCDETAVAITEDRKVIANGIYSQILIHKKWGGVVPSLAKRAHQERIDSVIEEVCKKFLLHRRAGPVLDSLPSVLDKISVPSGALPSDTHSHLVDSAFQFIDAVAVTQGPGLAMALEVGIKKAVELCETYKKKLIPVNHMEGHIYSCFAQNSAGKPELEFAFPYLALLVSGNHTEFVLFKNQVNYEVIGRTVDDAAGEALDKAARLLGLGYPGGELIERLADAVGNEDFYKLPRPMRQSGDLNLSFSGLKTALLYLYRDMKEDEQAKKVKELASSFQEAVFDSLLIKTRKAIAQTGVKNLVVAGGVAANQYLRKKLRALTKEIGGTVEFPKYKYLNGDNAAMIGIAAFFKAQKNMYAEDLSQIERVPRMEL